MITVNPKDIDKKDVYKLMTGLIVPRPIAFISTISGKGEHNLAPYSFFNAISSEPPTISVSIGRKPTGEPKDTLRNIMETGEFVVNVVHRDLAEKMTHTAETLPHGVSEFKEFGLTPGPAQLVKAPVVQESLAHMECRFYDKLEIGAFTLVVGEVLQFHIADSIWMDGYKINNAALQAVGRLAGNTYCETGTTFDYVRKG